MSTKLEGKITVHFTEGDDSVERLLRRIIEQKLYETRHEIYGRAPTVTASLTLSTEVGS